MKITVSFSGVIPIGEFENVYNAVLNVIREDIGVDKETIQAELINYL